MSRSGLTGAEQVLNDREPIAFSFLGQGRGVLKSQKGPEEKSDADTFHKSGNFPQLGI